MTEILTPAELAVLRRKPAKYRNRVEVQADGIRWHSQLEKRRYQDLTLMAQAGTISDLKRQVSFDLMVGGLLICRYVADATYMENGRYVVEDSKSPATRRESGYRIKNKLMRALFGIDVREIT